MCPGLASSAYSSALRSEYPTSSTPLWSSHLASFACKLNALSPTCHMLTDSQNIRAHYTVLGSPAASAHLPYLAQVRYLHPQVRDKLPSRCALSWYERHPVGQHLGKGHELDCCSYCSAIRRHLLRARWSKGSGVPGQQDSGRTGRCPDDHIRCNGRKRAAKAWLAGWDFAGDKMQNCVKIAGGKGRVWRVLQVSIFEKGAV